MVYRTGAQGTLDRPTIRRAYTGSTTGGGSPQQLRYNSPRTFPVGRERTHTSLTGRRVVVPTRRGGRKRASRPSPSPTQQSRSAAGGRPLAPTPRPSWPVVCVARSWAKNAADGPRPAGGAFPGNGPNGLLANRKRATWMLRPVCSVFSSETPPSRARGGPPPSRFARAPPAAAPGSGPPPSRSPGVQVHVGEDQRPRPAASIFIWRNTIL